MDDDDKIMLYVAGIMLLVIIAIAAVCFIGMEINADIEIKKAEAGLINCEEEKK